MTKCSKTFKMPDRITGDKSALAHRNAILKLQATNPAVSQKIPQSFTAQGVIKAQKEKREKKNSKKAASNERWSNIFRTMSDFGVSLKASNERNRLISKMQRAKNTALK